MRAADPCPTNNAKRAKHSKILKPGCFFVFTPFINCACACVYVCVFITAGPITKLFAGGGEWFILCKNTNLDGGFNLRSTRCEEAVSEGGPRLGVEAWPQRTR